MWLLYDDATNEFADLFNSYEELTKLYEELSNEDVELSWDLRDMEELDLGCMTQNNNIIMKIWNYIFYNKKILYFNICWKQKHINIFVIFFVKN